MKKAETVFWIVACEGHTDAWVNAPDWEQATVAAAAFWDVPWGTVAARCECKRKERALKGVCPKCGKVFYGDTELCGACLRMAKAEERNFRNYMKNRYRHTGRAKGGERNAGK